LGELLPTIRDIVIIIFGGVTAVALLILVRHLVPLLTSVRQLTGAATAAVTQLEDQTKHLGDIIISARALTDALNDTHRKTILPALQNVEEITDRVNRTARNVSYIVEEGSRFSHTTLRRATHYRDTVFRPIIEIASLWNGIRTVARLLPKRGRWSLPRSRKGKTDGKE
jgi:Na+/phosphate symporter